MRRTSGTLYSGSSSMGWYYLYKRDSTVTRLRSAADAAANDPNMGTVVQTSSGYKDGSVKYGATVAAGNASTVVPAWNPVDDTILLRQGNYGIDEVIAQSAAEEFQIINEGTATAKGGPTVTTAAWVCRVTAAVAFGYARAGLMVVERVDVGGTVYCRLFWVHAKYNTNDPGRFIRVMEMTDSISGWTSTAHGARTELRLFNGLTPVASPPYDASMLLNEVDYGNLVAEASDEYITGISIHEDTLYVLSYSTATTKTYLSAVKYKLPTDGVSPVAVAEVVDLDPGTENKYFVLDNLVPGIQGWGITFGSDTGDTLMYVGGKFGTTKLIYTFKLKIPSAPGFCITVR